MNLLAASHILIVCTLSVVPVWCLRERIFYISNQKTSWNQARATCENLGYQILDITSDVIQNVIMEFSTDFEWESTIYDNIWIGTHNSELTSSVDFRLGDCSSVTWSNWKNGGAVQPETRMCTALEYGSLKWISKPCSDTDAHVVCMADGGNCYFDVEYNTKCTANGLSVLYFDSLDKRACEDKCETTTDNGMNCWLYQWESSTGFCTNHFHNNPYFCDSSMKQTNSIQVGLRECFDFMVKSMQIEGLPLDSVPLIDCGQQMVTASTMSIATVTTQPAPDQTSLVTDLTTMIFSEQPSAPSGTDQSSTSLPTTSGMSTTTPLSSSSYHSDMSTVSGSIVSNPTGNNGILPPPPGGDLITSITSLSSVPPAPVTPMISSQSSFLLESPISPPATMLSSATLSLPSFPIASVTTSQASTNSAPSTLTPASAFVETTTHASSLLPSVSTTSSTTNPINTIQGTAGISAGLLCDSCSFSTCIYPRNTSLLELKHLLDNLLLDTHNLSSYRRRKKTEMDGRLTATSLGVTGVFVIILWFMFFVVMDATRLLCQPKRLHWNI